MTVHKTIFRIQGNENAIRNYFPKTGIESVVKPYQPENNLFDVMFRTSDTNPCLSERLLMEDINREVERMKFIYGGKLPNKLKDGSDRLRDSMFKKDLKDGNKTFMHHKSFEDENKLPEEFLSKANVEWGNPNHVPASDNERTINEKYIKAKKKYLQFIDSG